MRDSTSPFKFHWADFPQQAGLENDKMCISQTEIEKLFPACFKLFSENVFRHIDGNSSAHL